MQFGTPVLLQNIQEELDPSLAPILNKSVVKQGVCVQVFVKGMEQVPLLLASSHIHIHTTHMQYTPHTHIHTHIYTPHIGTPHIYTPHLCTPHLMHASYFTSVPLEGNRLIIRLGDKEVEFNLEFKFYITTKLSNPHYTPEISTKTAIVNFAVKEQGLEAQLLGIVVRKERPELEESKDKLVVNIAESKKKLKDLEDEILR